MSDIKKIAEKLSALELPNVDFEDYLKTVQTDKEKIKRIVDFYDEIEDYIENGHLYVGAKTPFDKLDGKLGFRSSEVTMWSGYNGHKKSMLLGQFAMEFIKQKERVCIGSFEMKPISTITRMTRQFSGVKNPSYEEFANFMSFAADELYIFDHLGGINQDRLFGIIHYCSKELNVKHFIIDSLMKVVSGEDDYNQQKDFIVKLCQTAQQTNTHIHLVHHVRDGDESKVSTRYQAKGSKTIGDNVHNSIIVWSNKHNDPDMPDAVLKCDKQREGEWEGKLALTFDKESLVFSQADWA